MKIMFTEIYQNAESYPDHGLGCVTLGDMFQFSKAGDLIIVANVISTCENKATRHNF